MPTTKDFGVYLKEAVASALADQDARKDDGNLLWMYKLSRQGVQANSDALTPEGFLEQYLWCVGSIRKKYWVHSRHFPAQMELFCQCSADAIMGKVKDIRRSWSQECKCDLNSRMLDAMIDTTAKVREGWVLFKRDYLPLPANPESESSKEWKASYDALDSLPVVGPAIAWYLIRNLYGAPFFKPDLHIKAIAAHYFDGDLEAMALAVRRLWTDACPDAIFKQVHLGVADYVLWWHRQKTRQPG